MQYIMFQLYASFPLLVSGNDDDKEIASEELKEEPEASTQDTDYKDYGKGSTIK